MLPHWPIHSFHQEIPYVVPHGAALFKLPKDKVTVVTAWASNFMPVRGVRLLGGPLVFGPGEEIRHYGETHETCWVAGYQYPVAPHVPESELQKVRKEFEGKLADERAKYEARVQEVRDLLKKASVAALKEASLAVLTSTVANGVVDRLPEKLMSAIQSVVDEAVERALQRAGRDP